MFIIYIVLFKTYINQFYTNKQYNNNNRQLKYNMNRPSWNEYFKEIVLATAKRSPCERLKVGCLLVFENRIISQGYNGFL